MRGDRQLPCHATHQELHNQVLQQSPQVFLPREIDRYKSWRCTTTALCSVFCGNWWALTCSGRPLTWSSAASVPTLLWTDTVSKSRRTVLIEKNSESSWAQGKCAACKLYGFLISRARVCREGCGQWKQLLQTANLPISLLIHRCTLCRTGHPYYGSTTKPPSRIVLISIDFINAEVWSAEVSKYLSC